MVKYPNLTWTIGQQRLAHYEVAERVLIDRTRFSRCLHGAGTFAPYEKSRISEALGYSGEWLFLEPRPPVRKAQSTRTNDSQVTGEPPGNVWKERLS